MRLAWLTDIHLNFCDAKRRRALHASVRSADAEAILVTGDTGEADSVFAYLDELARAAGLPLYFVLGNHDFYGGSIRAVRAAAPHASGTWLNQAGAITLTPQTALVGHDGWADGRCGDFFRSPVELNDYVYIEELAGLDRTSRFLALTTLADEAAAAIEANLRAALASRAHVVIATHVPPYRDACRYQGRISDDDWAPHFASRVMGERIDAVMAEFPHARATVLCGHTHGKALLRPRANVEVRVAAAEYGNPRIASVLTV